MSATCARRAHVSAAAARCGRPAVAVITRACVHEHIKTGSACAQHLAQWRDFGRVHCLDCWHCADRHLCPATFREAS